MTNLDFAKVVGRLGFTVADASDPDDDPEVIYCDQGTVRFIPLDTYTKVPAAIPFPFSAGHGTIDATITDADYVDPTVAGEDRTGARDGAGFVSLNSKPFVEVIDFTSDKVNPKIGANLATHKLQFLGLKATLEDGTVIDVEIDSVKVRLTKDGPDGSGINDLTAVMPVSDGKATPIYQGPQGASVQSASIVNSDQLVLGLTDGTSTPAVTLPAATSAINAASAAATSETNAAGSATAAATSETNAATSEANAAASELAAQGYADSAAGSVSLVAWAPATAYAAGDVRQAPDGSTIRRIANGTSGASFDAAEEAAWEAPEGDPTTIVGKALLASKAQAAEDAARSLAKGVSLTPLPGTLRGTRRFNATAYTQDPIQTTADGTQFAVWIDTDSNPIIGKRRIPSTEWETFDLSTIAGNPFSAPTDDDSHNSYSMAVDGDGYVHVSGNHHLSNLHYVRSSNPLDITAWDTPGMIGDTPEASTAYPQFLVLPSGDLLFTFRDEDAGANGAYYLNAYDTATQTWTRRAKLFDGTTVSPTQSPYLNKLALSTDGVLHLFFLWRESVLNDPAHSSNISHMQSADEGVTWTTADGTALTLPVTYDDATPVIAAGTVSGELNQSGAAVDSDGHPWGVWWHYDATFNVGYGVYIRRWDGSAWVSEWATKTGGGTADFTTLPRPQVFAWGDRMFLLYAREPDALGVRIKEITPGAVNPVVDRLLIRTGLGRYEPVYDLAAITARDELHVLVTPTKEANAATNPTYAETWGGVLTLDLNSLAHEPVAGENIFIPATQMLNNGGTGTATITSVNSTPVASITDDANTTEVVMQTKVPAHWNTFTLTVLWMPLAASPSGSAVFRVNAKWNDVGGTTGSLTNIGNLTTAAQTTQYRTTSSVFTTVFNNPPGDTRLLSLAVNRWAGNAADTLSGGLGIMGVILTRTS